jgi:transcriptional regulator with XRE-family HTH domain
MDGKDIAEPVVVYPSTISRLLSADSGPSLDAFEKLCDWLAMPMDDFRGAPVESAVDKRLASVSVHLKEVSRVMMEQRGRSDGPQSLVVAEIALNAVAAAIDMALAGDS